MRYLIAVGLFFIALCCAVVYALEPEPAEPFWTFHNGQLAFCIPQGTSPPACFVAPPQVRCTLVSI